MSQYPSYLDKEKTGGDAFIKNNLEFAEKMVNDEKLQEIIKTNDNSNNDFDSSTETLDAPNG